MRDYIYIGDVVDRLLAALGRTTDERIFNIGSGHGQSLNQLLDSIENVTGRTATTIRCSCKCTGRSKGQRIAGLVTKGEL